MPYYSFSLVESKPLAATGRFAAGYFLVWIGFSLAATLVQWVIERAALLDSRMASASNVLGGIVLIASGVYQWTPLKDVCLAQCQTPFQFLMRLGGFRGDVPGCLLLGLSHGAYCVGCCWVLMALLFVGGVMNVLWIALLALLIRHRCFARKRLRDDLRLGLGRPASPPARPGNHLDAANVPSVRVKRMSSIWSNRSQ